MPGFPLQCWDGDPQAHYDIYISPGFLPVQLEGTDNPVLMGTLFMKFLQMIRMGGVFIFLSFFFAKQNHLITISNELRIYIYFLQGFQMCPPIAVGVGKTVAEPLVSTATDEIRVFKKVT